MNRLFSPIECLSGVGQKREKLLAKLGIRTPYDLLYHIPRNYINYADTVKVSEKEVDNTVCVLVRVLRKLNAIETARITIYKIAVTDGATNFELTIFGNFYLFQSLSENEDYYVQGKLTEYYDKFQLNVAHAIPVTAKNLIHPIYPLTAGLTSAMLQTNVKESLEIARNELSDYMPEEILEKYDLSELLDTLENVHFPLDLGIMKTARRRIAFDELLVTQMGMQLIKTSNGDRTNFAMSPVDTEGLFPFELTNAQKKAIAEIFADMEKNVPMYRLLQGDVGSGKTAVAVAASLTAVKNGCQVAVMAPTEILANQHYSTFAKFLNDDVNMVLLTGSLSTKEKNAAYAKIKNGEAQIIIGTHALFQKKVEYQNLGLVIMDEQHRFGTQQRAALIAKGDAPHRLVMSATPIPRTLGLTIYGDLDITIIDEMPANRLPIETFAVTENLRERAFGFIKKELDKKHQAYIVCPAIGTSSEDNNSEDPEMLKSVVSYSENLSRGFFRNYKVGLVHGKLSAAEKDKVMGDFKNGEIDILVATTVVEVGVDVPNATIMVIENAERFGLSQLHQLRGRIGRGNAQSYCILIAALTAEQADNEMTKQRLKVISSTTDGFKIAEEDFKLRGSGDFLGNKQHGLPKFKIADIASDMDLISLTAECSKNILKEDKTLSTPKYHALKIEIMRMIELMRNG